MALHRTVLAVDLTGLMGRAPGLDTSKPTERRAPLRERAPAPPPPQAPPQKDGAAYDTIALEDEDDDFL